MFSKPIPREVRFSDYFNARADLVAQGGRALALLVEELVDGKGDVAARAKTSDDIESHADKITHDTIAAIAFSRGRVVF